MSASPKVGYVLSLGEIDAGYGLHPSMPHQQPNSIWTYGVGKNAARYRRC